MADQCLISDSSLDELHRAWGAWLARQGQAGPRPSRDTELTSFQDIGDLIGRTKQAAHHVEKQALGKLAAFALQELGRPAQSFEEVAELFARGPRRQDVVDAWLRAQCKI